MNSIDPNAAPQAGAGERGMPGFGRTKKKTNVGKLWIVGLIFVAVALSALGAAVFIKRAADRHMQAREDARNAPKASTAEKGHDFSVDAARLQREKDEQARLAAMAAASAASMPAPSGAASGPIAVTPVGAQPAGHPTAATQPAGQARTEAATPVDPLLVVGGTPDGGRNSSTEEAKPTSTASATATPVNTSGGLDDKLTPSRLASVKATWLPDEDYLLKRGTMIPCGQKTKIITTYPGMISCIVTKDVYSANGKTLLIERGSEATGEQRTALLQGQARIFALWSRIDTPGPNALAINVDSPGTDALGASGLDAYVDTHFWQRFSGALMLSAVSDIGQALSSRTVGGGSSQITLSSTSSSGQDLASETLKNTINIPPTAYSNQGSALNIFVARDVDFRSVYELAHP